MKITCFGLTDVGQKRSRNEDSHGIFATGLCVVADGMGGYTAGDKASKMVVEALQDAPDGGDLNQWFLNQIQEANDNILAFQQQHHIRRMGATFVAALIRQNEATIAHLGDSRAYLFRGNAFQQVTKDHSLVQQYKDSGHADEMTPEMLKRMSHIITKGVGIDEQAIPDVQTIPVQGRDLILLCSDGLTDMISDALIEAIIRKSGNRPEKAGRALVKAANIAGGKDNITVVLIQIVEM